MGWRDLKAWQKGAIVGFICLALIATETVVATPPVKSLYAEVDISLDDSTNSMIRESIAGYSNASANEVYLLKTYQWHVTTNYGPKPNKETIQYPIVALSNYGEFLVDEKSKKVFKIETVEDLGWRSILNGDEIFEYKISHAHAEHSVVQYMLDNGFTNNSTIFYRSKGVQLESDLTPCSRIENFFLSEDFSVPYYRCDFYFLTPGTNEEESFVYQRWEIDVDGFNGDFLEVANLQNVTFHNIKDRKAAIDILQSEVHFSAHETLYSVVMDFDKSINSSHGAAWRLSFISQSKIDEYILYDDGEIEKHAEESKRKEDIFGFLLFLLLLLLYLIVSALDGDPKGIAILITLVLVTIIIALTIRFIVRRLRKKKVE